MLQIHTASSVELLLNYLAMCLGFREKKSSPSPWINLHYA